VSGRAGVSEAPAGPETATSLFPRPRALGLDHCFPALAGKLGSLLGREKAAGELITDNPIQYP